MGYVQSELPREVHRSAGAGHREAECDYVRFASKGIGFTGPTGPLNANLAVGLTLNQAKVAMAHKF
jgi:hypothetical protein